MSEEQADGLERVGTFVGILVLTFAVAILLMGVMLRMLLPD